MVRDLERDGWQLDRQVGSHRQYRHPAKTGTVTVPGHLGDDLAPGTLNFDPAPSRSQEGSMSRYAVVIEQAEGNLSAYVPDLPGCVSTGGTLEEVQANIAEAIRLHVESLRAHGEAVPPPSSTTTLVEVAL